MKDLRSFLGLAQQLPSFVPDLAHMTSMLRPLLKKDIAWTWTDDHEKSFGEVKTLLTSKTIIHPFDQDADTFLLTDASRLHGMGFALMQQKGGGTLPHSMRLLLAYTYSATIRDSRARMHGHTVSH